MDSSSPTAVTEHPHNRPDASAPRDDAQQKTSRTDVHAPSRVLAIDLGLHCGIACLEGATNGNPPRLLWHRSAHFGTTRQMKSAIFPLLREAGPLALLVLEGDRNLGQPWLRAAEKQDIPAVLLAAERWRAESLLIREQRSGKDAKKAADRLAREIIHASGLSAPHRLQHDAAEAIVLGFWAGSRVETLRAEPRD